MIDELPGFMRNLIDSVEVDYARIETQILASIDGPPPPLVVNLADRARRAATLRNIPLLADIIGTPAPWANRSALEIMADVDNLLADMRVARHGPLGGLTRYGQPYRGRPTLYGAPAPLSKRARRRARGKAKS
jgi:hypothetical protein